MFFIPLHNPLASSAQEQGVLTLTCLAKRSGGTVGAIVNCKTEIITKEREKEIKCNREQIIKRNNVSAERGKEERERRNREKNWEKRGR